MMKSKRDGARGDERVGDVVHVKGALLLSFDIEEFDLPREHGGEISVERVGHEVGCHGVDHFRPQKGDATRSMEIVGRVVGLPIYGYRQPRMFPISYEELSKCGYLYDSSVNPAFIPGRYNHFDVLRRPFMRKGVVEVPTSVATGMRVPLFWLALHLFPLSLYLTLCRVSLRETGYLATYFHPWEFSEIRGYSEVPFYIKRNSGEKLVRRLEKVVRALAADGYEFMTYREYVEKIIQKKGKV